MKPIMITDFDAFFNELYDHDPYSWQRRLAQRAVTGDWPGAIDLPTGSGKTACIDIAIFALACQVALPIEQRTAPRRIFFCVNRRVIVDEAYRRARNIAEELLNAENKKPADKQILVRVAKSLRELSGIAEGESRVPPLDVLELRGGIYRDNRWARSVTQPTVICSTIDQIGSRLLFRGYGVSSFAAPIQAALVAYDSLLLLDEAHISEPFRQTVSSVRSYLDAERWSRESIGPKPLIFVPMTATPKDVEPDNVVALDAKDRANKGLSRRLSASKIAKLTDEADLVKAAEKLAKAYIKGEPKAIGIIVNRVATARQIYGSLKKEYPDACVELVIGSMRPVDRDTQQGRLRNLVGPKRPDKTQTASFIVSTQCLEVGADYDFDVLITECASLDALRQRFGRLNRGGRDIEAEAVIFVNKKDVKPDDKLDDTRPLDPIYGNALSRTWNWLNTHAADDTRIDFGIDSFSALLDENASGRIPDALLSPSVLLNAPTMVPAYIDLWCQTSPTPEPEPDVSLFLHGRQEGGAPDVQVCWRGDLLDKETHFFQIPDTHSEEIKLLDNRCLPRDVRQSFIDAGIRLRGRIVVQVVSRGEAWRLIGRNATYMLRKRGSLSVYDSHSNLWCDIVSLLPPTAAECMSVPIPRIKRWLTEQTALSLDSSDLIGAEAVADVNTWKTPTPIGVVWRGAKESTVIQTADGITQIRPGDTIVLPVFANGWNELGHIPTDAKGKVTDDNDAEVAWSESAFIDVAEDAWEGARDRCALRIHQSMKLRYPKDERVDHLFDLASRSDERVEVREWQNALVGFTESLGETMPTLAARARVLSNSSFGLIVEQYPDLCGVVLTSRKRLKRSEWFRAQFKWFTPTIEEDNDESSRSLQGEVRLSDHTRHVVDAVLDVWDRIQPNARREIFELSAQLHDLGKADERFQAMLRRSDRTDSWLSWHNDRSLLAKSDGLPLSRKESRLARERAQLPEGFRHETLSVQLVARSKLLPDDPIERYLVLHLIAAHHGRARPFAPIVRDDDPPDVSVEDHYVSSDERKASAPHHLSSRVGERFWMLTRHYGWWGLAYLESIVRLSDQFASAMEDAGAFVEQDTTSKTEVAT